MGHLSITMIKITVVMGSIFILFFVTNLSVIGIFMHTLLKIIYSLNPLYFKRQEIVLCHLTEKNIQQFATN